MPHRILMFLKYLLGSHSCLRSHHINWVSDQITNQISGSKPTTLGWPWQKPKHFSTWPNSSRPFSTSTMDWWVLLPKKVSPMEYFRVWTNPTPFSQWLGGYSPIRAFTCCKLLGSGDMRNCETCAGFGSGQRSVQPWDQEVSSHPAPTPPEKHLPGSFSYMLLYSSTYILLYALPFLKHLLTYQFSCSQRQRRPKNCLMKSHWVQEAGEIIYFERKGIV